jgi:hypothetical protein
VVSVDFVLDAYARMFDPADDFDPDSQEGATS